MLWIFLGLPNLASVIENKYVSHKTNNYCIHFKCIALGQIIQPWPQWFCFRLWHPPRRLSKGLDFETHILLEFKTQKKGGSLSIGPLLTKKKKTQLFPILLVCSGLPLSLFFFSLSYSTPNRWFLNAFRAWEELRYNHIWRKPLRKVSFFFFCLLY